VHATFTTIKNLETSIIGSGPFSDLGFGAYKSRIIGFNIPIPCCSIATVAISKKAKRKGLLSRTLEALVVTKTRVAEAINSK
jgi:hypothetical protein